MSFCKARAFTSVRKVTRNGMTRSYERSVFNFWKKSQLFSNAIVTFSIPTRSTCMFVCPKSALVLCEFVRLPPKGVVTSHCILHLTWKSPNDHWSFNVLLWHLYVFSSSVRAHFHVGLCFLLFWGFTFFIKILTRPMLYKYFIQLAVEFSFSLNVLFWWTEVLLIFTKFNLLFF